MGKKKARNNRLVSSDEEFSASFSEEEAASTPESSADESDSSRNRASTSRVRIKTGSNKSKGKGKARAKEKDSTSTTSANDDIAGSVGALATSRQRQCAIRNRYRELTGKEHAELPDVEKIKSKLIPFHRLPPPPLSLDALSKIRIPAQHAYLYPHLLLDFKSNTLMEYRPKALEEGFSEDDEDDDDDEVDEEGSSKGSEGSKKKAEQGTGREGITANGWDNLFLTSGQLVFNAPAFPRPTRLEPVVPRPIWSRPHSPRPTSPELGVPDASSFEPSSFSQDDLVQPSDLQTVYEETEAAFEQMDMDVDEDTDMIDASSETEMGEPEEHHIISSTPAPQHAMSPTPSLEHVVSPTLSPRHQIISPTPSPEPGTPEPASYSPTPITAGSSPAIHIYQQIQQPARVQDSDDEDDGFEMLDVISKPPRKSKILPPWYKTTYSIDIDDD